jgi:hypothetical protein
LDNLDGQPYDREASTRLVLARALRRARAGLLWERVWPALATLATALGLFLAFSWAGLWLVLPPVLHIAALVVFLVAIVAAAFPLLRLRLPTTTEALNAPAGNGTVRRRL